MAKTRVVRAALWRYRDADGSRRIARFGDTVELTADEERRGAEAGVFDPAPVPAVTSSAVERALAGIESRTPGPTLVGDDGDLPLHHDVTNRAAELTAAEEAGALEAAGTGDTTVAVQDPAVTTPPAAETPQEATGPAAGTGDTTEPANDVPAPKRPAKAADVDVWRAYIAGVRPDLADEVAGMSKAELQAQAPKDD